jgi:hypothetical protein
MRELKRRKLEKQTAWIDKSYREDPGSWEGSPRPQEVREVFEAKALEVELGLVVLKDFLNDEGWTGEQEKSLKAEIIEDIADIVTPSDGHEVFTALQKLVHKINTMNIYPPWSVTEKWDENPWVVKKGPLAGMPLVGVASPPVGPVMRISGKKFIVYHTLDTFLPDNRKDFYTVIIKALEDGSFQKFKRCKECSLFFIADRLSEKFCRPECSKAYFDRGAVDRVRESRATKRADMKQPKKRRRPAKVKRKRRTRS